MGRRNHLFESHKLLSVHTAPVAVVNGRHGAEELIELIGSRESHHFVQKHWRGAFRYMKASSVHGLEL